MMAFISKCCNRECNWKLPACIAACIIVSDQWTKYCVVNSERLFHYHRIEVIPNFFHIVYVTNTGAAWGMFQGYSALLGLVSIAAIAFILICYEKFTNGYFERCLSMGFILGGIGGNLIDRVWRKNVVDFLSFFYKSFEWPAFNIADSAICTGVALYTVSSILRPDEPDQPHALS